MGARPGWKFWFLWMVGTVVGAVVGIVLSVPFQLILEVALGRTGSGPWTATETALIVVFKGAEGGVMGLGVGVGQWWVLRKYLTQMGGWVLATSLAMFLQGAFRWSIPSDTPSLQVGVIITIGFGIFLGLCQWFVLRGRVPYAGWWIAMSIAGWMPALALIASELPQLSIQSFLGAVVFALSMLTPFAVAGGGMVWFLRQTSPA